MAIAVNRRLAEKVLKRQNSFKITAQNVYYNIR